ncbi:hypothetical protein HK103_004325 [Boothiomyces macroporosus]|uniref:Protein kinase domain-containing protein n=1 Tax=Boothiomyces macroporosus TaxID=261099 RepID=A0AAD5UHA6_9FUNG|nr:hypothetical protein HK103_004325 [Boothiomyces macroporosus]
MSTERWYVQFGDFYTLTIQQHDLNERDIKTVKHLFKAFFRYLNCTRAHLFYLNEGKETFYSMDDKLSSMPSGSLTNPLRVAYFADGNYLTKSSKVVSIPTSELKLVYLTTELPFRHKPQKYNLKDFQELGVIGQGKSTVIQTKYENENAAMKIVHTIKDPKLFFELLNEVAAYEYLQEFQGKLIPKFFTHGYFEVGIYCIVISPCGTPGKTFSLAQKKSLLESLDLIHSKGLLHRSIKRDNITIDKEGHPYFIDFGHAKWNPTESEKKEEREMLLSIITR